MHVQGTLARLWRWYELVVHTRTERFGGAMTHGANPDGLLSTPHVEMHMADAAHLAGSDEMFKAIDAATPLLDVSCSSSSWRSLVRIEDTEYAGRVSLLLLPEAAALRRDQGQSPYRPHIPAVRRA